MASDRSQSSASELISGNVRIARFLAACGLGSRRACEKLIQEGGVTINGVSIDTPAMTVDVEQDLVCYKGEPLRLWSPCYLKLNKPPGYTCSASDPHASKLVFDLLPKDRGRLFTVGRLDRDSEGLIIVTNDGDFAQHLAHPRHQIAKCYRVQVVGDVTEGALKAMTDGLLDEGERLRAESVRICGTVRPGITELEMILREGKKREIRRLCRCVGLMVKRLQRLSIGPVTLGELKPGQWQELTAHELNSIRHTSP